MFCKLVGASHADPTEPHACSTPKSAGPASHSYAEATNSPRTQAAHIQRLLDGHPRLRTAWDALQELRGPYFIAEDHDDALGVC